MAELRGQIKADEAMAGHVSWRAGGPAARAYFPATSTISLSSSVACATTSRCCWSAWAATCWCATAVSTAPQSSPTARSTRCAASRRRFYAEAGVASPKLARFVANAGCAEAEFLAGIPGTVGGALAMNAGCHGGETWRYVDQVLMLNRQGERDPARCRRISRSATAMSD
jgi:UDP-N-acetylmuramate dehydrogenase